MFSSAASRDTEVSACCTGISTQFLLFGICLGEKVANNLSKAQQSKVYLQFKSNTWQGSQWTALNCYVVTKNLMNFAIQQQALFGVNEPTLPRKMKVPQCYEMVYTNSAYFHSSPKEHFRQVYYEAVDTLTQCNSE